MERGNALLPSYALELWYRKEIQKLCREMMRETRKVIVPEYDPKKVALDSMSVNIRISINELIRKYEKIFNTQGKELAKKFLSKQIKYVNGSVRHSITPLLKEGSKFALKGSVTEAYSDIIRMSIENNASLIKSISQEYFTSVTGIISRSMGAGGSISHLKKDLMHYEGITERRAKNIAFDQTRKVYSDLSVRQISEAGFNKVMWNHSGGSQEPREYHQRVWDGVSGIKDGRPNGLNKFVFELSNPPVIQHAKGKQPEIRGLTNQLVNCKCFLTPVRD